MVDEQSCAESGVHEGQPRTQEAVGASEELASKHQGDETVCISLELAHKMSSRRASGGRSLTLLRQAPLGPFAELIA